LSILKAMKAKDKERLGTLRLVTAAIKQIEIDERTELDDARTLAVLEKMTKQRKDSITQFEQAGRDDLVVIEQAELKIIGEFIAETGAESMRDMGKVMGIVRAATSGLDDMGAISGMIKAKLS